MVAGREREDTTVLVLTPFLSLRDFVSTVCTFTGNRHTLFNVYFCWRFVVSIVLHAGLHPDDLYLLHVGIGGVSAVLPNFDARSANTVVAHLDSCSFR